MRIAALYDIHGNLPALEAVLTDVRREGVDTVVIGGDVVPGPMPVETLQCATSLAVPTRFIQGNGETDVVAAAAGAPINHVPESVRPVLHWTAEQLTPGQLHTIDGWALSTTVTAPGIGDVLLCHATPSSNTDIFTRLTPDATLVDAFRDVQQDLVICGHTHMQFDRMVASLRVVNAGSVGMSFQGAGAYWLLLGDRVELRRTHYDVDVAAARLRGSAYPGVDEFIERYVLDSPSEADTLELFASMEMV